MLISPLYKQTFNIIITIAGTTSITFFSIVFIFCSEVLAEYCLFMYSLD